MLFPPLQDYMCFASEVGVTNRIVVSSLLMSTSEPPLPIYLSILQSRGALSLKYVSGPFYLFIYFEIGSHSVVQAGLKLAILLF